MHLISRRIAYMALSAVISAGMFISLPDTAVYAEKPTTTYSTAKTEAKRKGIKPPSANYTGLARSGGKSYYFRDGKPCTGFIKTNAGYMYFDPKTYEMTTGFVYSKGLYRFGSDGIMLKDGMYKIDNTYYYFGKDGKATSYPVSGKKTIPIPNILKYDMTSVVGFMYRQSGKYVTNSKKQGVIESYQKYLDTGIFNVQVEGTDHESFADDMTSDMEELGYGVELFDTTEEDHIYMETYALRKDDDTVGMLAIYYNYELDFTAVSVVGF